MFPNRVSTNSNTPSPEPLVCFSFIHSFSHVRLPESPKRSPSTYIWKKTHTELKEPCPFNKVPDGPYASGSKQGTHIYFLFSQKSRQTNPLQVPYRGPCRERNPSTGILHISKKSHLFGSPVKEPSPKVPFMEPFTERCPTTAALLHSPTKVPGIRAPSSRREMPASRDFPNISSESLVKEIPPRPPPRSLFRERERERDTPSQSPLHPSLKVPGR